MEQEPISDYQPISRQGSTYSVADEIGTALITVRYSVGEQQMQQQSRYQELSSQQTYALHLLRQGYMPSQSHEERLIINHRPTDAAVWTLMHHHPLGEDFLTIAADLRSRFPDLLETADRELLTHCCHIHYLLHHGNTSACTNYIAAQYREERSYLIQTYKQLLMASCDHHNGRSCYIKYMPILGHDPAINMEEEDFFAGIGGQERFVAPTPGEIQSLPLVHTPLERLFHDILYLYAAAPYRPGTERLALIHTNSTYGFVDPKHHGLYEYFRSPRSDGETPQLTPEVLPDTLPPDDYLEKKVVGMQEMGGLVRDILSINCFLLGKKIRKSHIPILSELGKKILHIKVHNR